MIDKQKVLKHFDRHAFQYERYAVVQRQMAVRLAERFVQRFTEKIGEKMMEKGERANGERRILEIGCGTGRLTRKLLRHLPQARITAVDLSPAMIAQCHSRLGDEAHRVQFVCGDAEDVERLSARSGGGFDAIVSNATFQWFNHPSETLRALTQLLSPDGPALIAFSTFGPGTFGELHEAFRQAETRLAMEHVPHGQSFPSSAYWDEAAASLACAGDLPSPVEGRPGRALKLLDSWEETAVYYFPTVREFLLQVKKIGAGNALSSSRGGIGGRRLLEEMERCYARQFGQPRGVPATYELMYKIYAMQ